MDPGDRSLVRAIDDRIDRVKRAGLKAAAPLVRGRRTRRSRRLGIVLSLDTSRYIDYLIFMQGVYERSTFDLIDSALASWQSDSQFLDVGANIGAMCTYVAVRYPDTRAVAFEPVDFLADEIIGQQRSNSVDFPLQRIALSDRDGSIALFPPAQAEAARRHFGKQNPGMTSAHPGSLHDRDASEVPTRTLDSLIAEGGLIDPSLPTLVKIDVEGHESAVLRGMEGFLSDSADRWLAVEILAESHPERVAEVWDFVTDLDYRGEFLGRRHRFPCERPTYDGMYLLRRGSAR